MNHWRSRMDLDSFFIVVYEFRAGSGGGTARVGTRCGLRSGSEGRPSKRGRTRCVISSIGRCLRMVLRGVFHIRGGFAGLSLVRRERWHWGDLKVDLFGTDLWSRPAAGCISGGEEANLRAAMH